MRTIPTLHSLALCAALSGACTGAQATTLNLGTVGASGSLNGALFTQASPQPAGSGFIDSFVRVGAANQDMVQAYNTSAATPFDNVGGASFNHAIAVGQVGFVEGANGPVMRFLLDINQTQSSPLLNLDEVQVFVSTTPNQAAASFSGGLLDLTDAALVYWLDAGGDNTVTLDYTLNPGSGAGDMTLDIAATAFNPAFATLGLLTDDQKNGAYVYLYSRFGSAPHVNNDGYEEWAYAQGKPIDPPPGVPEPSSLALLATAVAGLGLRRRTTA